MQDKTQNLTHRYRGHCRHHEYGWEYYEIYALPKALNQSTSVIRVIISATQCYYCRPWPCIGFKHKS